MSFSSSGSSSSIFTGGLFRNLIAGAIGLRETAYQPKYPGPWLKVNGGHGCYIETAKQLLNIVTVEPCQWKEVCTKRILVFKNGKKWGECHEMLLLEIVDATTYKVLDYWRIEHFGVPMTSAKKGGKVIPWHEMASSANSVLNLTESLREPNSDHNEANTTTPPPILPSPSDETTTSFLGVSPARHRFGPNTNRFTSSRNNTKHSMLNREGEKTDEAHVSISFNSIPVSPYQILVLASCIKNMAPDYKHLTHSSYFFVRVVTALAEKLFQGQREETEGNRLEKALELAYLDNGICNQKMVEVEEMYLRKWEDVEAEVSSLFKTYLNNLLKVCALSVG